MAVRVHLTWNNRVQRIAVAFVNFQTEFKSKAAVTAIATDIQTNRRACSVELKPDVVCTHTLATRLGLRCAEARRGRIQLTKEIGIDPHRNRAGAFVVWWRR